MELKETIEVINQVMEAQRVNKATLARKLCIDRSELSRILNIQRTESILQKACIQLNIRP